VLPPGPRAAPPGRGLRVARIWTLRDEVEVGRESSALNAEIARTNARTAEGPPTRLAPLDVDASWPSGALARRAGPERSEHQPILEGASPVAGDLKLGAPGVLEPE